MLGRILKYRYKILAISLLLLALIGVRYVETSIFYDPFIGYFQGEFSKKPLPQVDGWSLFLSTLLRYGLNSVISLVIIYAIFTEIPMIKFAAFLYIGFFVILVVLLYVFLMSENPPKMYIFYVRRFLIQPLFLLLFIPGFYFQKLQGGK